MVCITTSLPQISAVKDRHVEVKVIWRVPLPGVGLLHVGDDLSAEHVDHEADLHGAREGETIVCKGVCLHARILLRCS